MGNKGGKWHWLQLGDRMKRVSLILLPKILPEISVDFDLERDSLTGWTCA